MLSMSMPIPTQASPTRDVSLRGLLRQPPTELFGERGTAVAGPVQNRKGGRHAFHVGATVRIGFEARLEMVHEMVRLLLQER